MKESFEKLQKHLERSAALGVAMGLFYWDGDTLAPKEASEYTAKVLAILSAEQFDIMMGETTRELLAACEQEEKPSEEEEAILRVIHRQFENLEKIPKDDFARFQELTTKAHVVWREAKEKNDYALFAPTLQEILDMSRKFASLRVKEGQAPYDVLLNDCEEGFTMDILDPFFAKMKEEIVPLLRKVQENPVPKLPVHSCPLDKQRAFNCTLATYIGFDFNRGAIGETEHPFSDALHTHDVRIATHYYEDNPESGLFSTIHEAGHSIYEQQINPAYNLTPLGGGGSCALHESQSRFYENMIGRRPSFWKPLYASMQEAMPEAFEKISLEEFLREINRAEASLVRTEADELTYSLHILVRYELEKQLFSGELTVEQLPEAWNAKYKEYLDVVPPTDTEGVLQDVHWSSGSFGYFPSYALGSAIAAQIFACMQKQMPVDQQLEEGNLQPVKDFLREHIHRWGKVKTTRQLLLETTGEDFNPQYYIDYLKEKFGR